MLQCAPSFSEVESNRRYFEDLIFNGPTRVVTDFRGYATAPKRALEEDADNIPCHICVRTDGWSVGFPPRFDTHDTVRNVLGSDELQYELTLPTDRWHRKEFALEHWCIWSA